VSPSARPAPPRREFAPDANNDTEPLPLGDSLRLAPNTVLTPHLGYVTDDTYRVFYGEAVEDIAAFAQGDPIRVLSP
jgi:phosphoglycerate dehydrogenase-like enzyme